MHTRAYVPVLLLAALAACGESEGRATASSTASGAGSATAADAGDANSRELEEYELTMDDLKKLEKAQLSLEELKRARPDLKERLERDDPDEDVEGATFDDVEARINEVPEARRAIESAGLDAREYVVVLVGLLQASMADVMMEQGTNADSVLLEMQVNPANVEFVRRHRAEVARVMQIGES